MLFASYRLCVCGCLCFTGLVLAGVYVASLCGILCVSSLCTVGGGDGICDRSEGYQSVCS